MDEDEFGEHDALPVDATEVDIMAVDATELASEGCSTVNDETEDDDLTFSSSDVEFIIDVRVIMSDSEGHTTGDIHMSRSCSSESMTDGYCSESSRAVVGDDAHNPPEVRGSDDVVVPASDVDVVGASSSRNDVMVDVVNPENSRNTRLVGVSGEESDMDVDVETVDDDDLSVDLTAADDLKAKIQYGKDSVKLGAKVNIVCHRDGAKKNIVFQHDGAKENIVSQHDGVKEGIVSHDGVKKGIVSQDGVKEDIVSHGVKKGIVSHDGVKEDIVSHDGVKKGIVSHHDSAKEDIVSHAEEPEKTVASDNNDHSNDNDEQLRDDDNDQPRDDDVPSQLVVNKKRSSPHKTSKARVSVAKASRYVCVSTDEQTSPVVEIHDQQHTDSVTSAGSAQHTHKRNTHVVDIHQTKEDSYVVDAKQGEQSRAPIRCSSPIGTSRSDGYGQCRNLTCSSSPIYSESVTDRGGGCGDPLLGVASPVHDRSSVRDDSATSLGISSLNRECHTPLSTEHVMLDLPMNVDCPTDKLKSGQTRQEGHVTERQKSDEVLTKEKHGACTAVTETKIFSENTDVCLESNSKDVHLESSSKDVHLESSSKDVHLESSSKDVHLESSSKDVHLKSSSKDVHLESSSKDVHLESSSKDVHLKSSSKDVHLESSSKDVHLESSSKDVHLKSSSKDVHLESSSKDVHLESSSKDVHLESSSKDVRLESSSKDVCLESSSKDVHLESSREMSEDIFSDTSPSYDMEKNNAFINEQLLILNSESSHLNTSIHRSGSEKAEQAKKQQTPKKGKPGAKIRKPVKRKLEEFDSTEHKVKKLGCSPREDSDSDSNCSLLIDEEKVPDDNIDDQLERKAQETGLTATNVKNILHHLITNDDVMVMVKNSVMEGMTDDQKDLLEAAFEPKMTRAAVRKALETGQVASVWPLSPLKKKAATKPSILDMDFPEDEDDDEYNPENDMEAHESDDDESILSSQISEFGSPCPPTPLTPSTNPQSVPSDAQASSQEKPSAEDSSPDNAVRSLVSEQQLRPAMPAVVSSTLLEDANSGTIAERTRSKLPLKDTSLMEIEEALCYVAPDITPDMYDTQCDDSDWQDFIRSLIGLEDQPDPVEVADDETTDPEYDYLAEADSIVTDPEDFRFDRPFRVSKKELTVLMEELHQLFPEADEEEERIEYRHQESSRPEPSPPKPLTVAELARAEVMAPHLQVSAEQKLMIEDHMRKHIQLTCQMYVLCLGSKDYRSMSSSCVQILRELELFRTVSVAGVNSSFNVCNLPPALELIDSEHNWNIAQEVDEMSHDETGSNSTDSDVESLDLSKSKNAHEKLNKGWLLMSQKDVLWNSPVFLYPHLLVMRRLLSQEKALDMRTCFTPAEDNLIALGMEQFRCLPHYCRYIQKYMMPCKSVQQIYIRIKNLNTKRAGDNPVKFFRKHDKPPTFPFVVDHFTPDRMKAPRDQDICLLPPWCLKYRDYLRREHKAAQATSQVTRKKRSSSLPGDEIAESSELRRCCFSAPDSPVNNELSLSDRQKKKKKAKKNNRLTVEDLNKDKPVTITASDQAVPKVIITSDGLFIPIKIASGVHQTPTKNKVTQVSNDGSQSHITDTTDAENVSDLKTPDSTTHVAPTVKGTICLVPGRTSRLTLIIQDTAGGGNGTAVVNSPDTAVNDWASESPISESPISSDKAGMSPHTGSGDWANEQPVSPGKAENDIAKPRPMITSEGSSPESAHICPLSSSVCDGSTVECHGNLHSESTAVHPTPNGSPSVCQVSPNRDSEESPVDNPLVGSDDASPVAPGDTRLLNTNNSAQVSPRSMSVSGSNRVQVVPSVMPVQTDKIIPVTSVESVVVSDGSGILLTSKITSENTCDDEVSVKQGSSPVLAAATTGGTEVFGGFTSTGDSQRKGQADSDTRIHREKDLVETYIEKDQETCKERDQMETCEEKEKTVTHIARDDMERGQMEIHMEKNNKETHTEINQMETRMERDQIESCIEITEMETRIDIDQMETHVENKHVETHMERDQMKTDVKKDKIETLVDREQMETHVERKQMETHVEKEQLDTHVDKKQMETQMDREQTETHVEREQTDTHVERTQMETHVEREQTETHVESEQIEIHVERTQMETHVEREQIETHVERTQMETHVERDLVERDGCDCEETGPTGASPNMPHSDGVNDLNPSSAGSDDPSQNQLSTCVEAIKSVAASQPPNNQVQLGPGARSEAVNKPVTSDQVDTHVKSRSPLEIIAALSPFYAEAVLKSPNAKTYQQRILEKTPVKKTQLKTIKPKASPVGPSLPSVSPFLEKVHKSPKRAQLQQKARSILPKGFIVDNKDSPTKIVARGLKRRAQMFAHRVSPCKLLPKTEAQRVPISIPLGPRQPKRKRSAGKQKNKAVYPNESDLSDEASDGDELPSGSRISLKKTGVPAVDQVRDGVEDLDSKMEESDEAVSDDGAGMSKDDSHTKDHLDDLMAASTTIRFNSKKQSALDRNNSLTKSQKRKEITLAMLAPDLLETDPRKDEKDTAFAQAYLNRAKEVLKDNMELYEHFLRYMYEFGKGGLSVEKLFTKIQSLFADYPELASDFAAFLSPHQAVSCGCFMANHEFIRARTFLRKLEIYFEKQQSQFQRVLKAFHSWFQQPDKPPSDLKESVQPLLKGMPYLLDEFSRFFPEDKPSQTTALDYEEVTLNDSDLEVDAEIDSAEEIEIPDELETYRTKRCRCECHSNTADIKLQKRLQHCYNCSLRVIDGRLYFQTSSKKIMPVKITFHKPVTLPGKPSSTAHSDDEDEESDFEVADKENINITARPLIVSPSTSSHVSPAKARRIKLKNVSQKSGQKRFVTLNEVASTQESPHKIKNSSFSSSCTGVDTSRVSSNPVDPQTEKTHSLTDNSRLTAEVKTSASSTNLEEGGKSLPGLSDGQIESVVDIDSHRESQPSVIDSRSDCQPTGSGGDSMTDAIDCSTHGEDPLQSCNDILARAMMSACVKPSEESVSMDFFQKLLASASNSPVKQQNVDGLGSCPDKVDAEGSSRSATASDLVQKFVMAGLIQSRTTSPKKDSPDRGPNHDAESSNSQQVQLAVELLQKFAETGLASASQSRTSASQSRTGLVDRADSSRQMISEGKSEQEAEHSQHSLMHRFLEAGLRSRTNSPIKTAASDQRGQPEPGSDSQLIFSAGFLQRLLEMSNSTNNSPVKKTSAVAEKDQASGNSLEKDARSEHSGDAVNSSHDSLVCSSEKLRGHLEKTDSSSADKPVEMGSSPPLDQVSPVRKFDDNVIVVDDDSDDDDNGDDEDDDSDLSPTAILQSENETSPSFRHQSRSQVDRKPLSSSSPEGDVCAALSGESDSSEEPFLDTEMSSDLDSEEDSSISDQETRAEKQHIVWTREMDKVLILRYKMIGAIEDTCKVVSKELKTVTPKQVAERFSQITAIIEEMEEDWESDSS